MLGQMRKLALIIVMIVTYGIVNAQSTININGREFSVVCDDLTMTATIVDNEYQIEDYNNIICDRSRKIPNMKQNGYVLQIPSKCTIFNKEYTISKIGRCAFADYRNLKYVVIPPTVTEIDDYAFFRSKVIDVVIPGSVQRIGNRAFGYCKDLRTLKIPANIAEMGNDVYKESRNVTISYSGDSMLAKNNATKKSDATKEREEPLAISDIDQNIPLTTTDNVNTFAVIIANENYQNQVDVEYALNDGKSFKRYCQMTLGIPEENIRYTENATLGAMIREFNWLSRVGDTYKGDAKFIVYYAGHGMPDFETQSAYLLPVDGDASDVRSGFSLHSLYEKLNNVDAQHITLFLDACFSGTQRSGEMIAQNERAVAVKVKNDIPEGKIITFAASQGDETAHSFGRQGHGLFTYFLLKKLQQTSGEVTLEDLSEYVIDEVGRRAVIRNYSQTPTISPSTSFGDDWRSITLR